MFISLNDDQLIYLESFFCRKAGHDSTIRYLGAKDAENAVVTIKSIYQIIDKSEV